MAAVLLAGQTGRSHGVRYDDESFPRTGPEGEPQPGIVHVRAVAVELREDFLVQQRPLGKTRFLVRNAAHAVEQVRDAQGGDGIKGAQRLE